MSVCIWCTSWSVVGRGYCSGGVRSMRPRTLSAWYLQVKECCGLGGGSVRVSRPAWPCLWAVGMAQIQGWGPCGRPGAVDPLDQAEHVQSQVVARPPRGDLGQGAGQGFGPLAGGRP